MGRKLIPNHEHKQRPVFPPRPIPRGPYPVLALLSEGYPGVRGRLLTCYAPVRHCTQGPKSPFSYDLHVLSTPPAFVLSQDQTLRTNEIETRTLRSKPHLEALTRRARITITIVKELVALCNVLNTIPNPFSPVNRTAGEKYNSGIRRAAHRARHTESWHRNAQNARPHPSDLANPLCKRGKALARP